MQFFAKAQFFTLELRRIFLNIWMIHTQIGI